MQEVIMPKFGFTQETAEIVRWLVQEGDTIERGDPIAEVTTDKVNMEVEAPGDGIIHALGYPVGAVVPVTEVICYLLEPGEAPPKEMPKREPTLPVEPDDGKEEVELPLRSNFATPVASRLAQEAGVDLQGVSGSGPGGRITRKDVEAQLTQAAEAGKVNAVPAARRLAHEVGVELRQVSGSGPGGRVQSSDVQAASVAMGPQGVLPAGATPVLRRIPVTGMRKTIARRLQKSAQEAPHITFDIDVDVTALQALRERANSEISEGQKRVSLTAVLAKATAWALERNPLLNAWLVGNEHDQEIVVLAQVNMGIAVALEEGLIVPVVRDAARKGILQLSEEVNDLAERARANRLLPDEVAEGTFTISNLGMFGIDRFDAIINPPQVAILAVSRVRKQVLADAEDHPVVRPVTTLTLSADHRAVDGAVAARFMGDLREALEHPEIITL